MIVVVDELDLLVDYLHGKYLKEVDLILETLFMFSINLNVVLILYSPRKNMQKENMPDVLEWTEGN